MVLLSISVVSAASTDLNNSTQKSNIDNDGILGDSGTGSLSDLSQNITDAGSTLNLTHNYVYNSTKDASINVKGIAISKPIIIDGNGYKIDAGGARRIFEITSSNVLLKNIVFSKGYRAAGGGAVFVHSGVVNVTFENCVFDSNTATTSGGAIYSESAIKINFCNFTNNKASDSGGAVHFYSSNSVVNNSIFYNNVAQFGGALYLNSQNTTIYNSNFTLNQGTSWGGAINDAATVHSYSIIKCNFYNNTVVNGGAAFNSNGGSSTSEYTCIIDQCTFKYNHVTRTSLTADTGGVIRNVGKGVLVNNSNFEENYNALCGGGVLFALSSSNNAILNSNFTHNRAARGGAVYLTSSNSRIDNCRFADNYITGSNYGGAVSWNGANGNITNCSFINNTAAYAALQISTASTTVTNCIFLGNKGNTYGGAIATTAAAKIYDSYFQYNQAPAGSVLYSSVSGAVLSDCVILDNIDTGSDKYIIYSTAANVNVDNNWWGTTLNDKSTKPVNVYHATLNSWYFLNIEATPWCSLGDFISNVTIRLNQLSTSSGVVSSRDFKYSKKIELNLTSNRGVISVNNVTLFNNGNETLTFTVDDLGAYNLTAKHGSVSAVKYLFHVPEDSISALNITLANATDVLNLTHNYKYYDEYDFQFITDCIKFNNPIQINGNGYTIDAKNKVRIFYVNASNVVVNNLTILNGNASDGGAIYWTGANGLINNSNFEKNYASSQGGAIYWAGVNGVIYNSNFTNNSANSDHWAGGAVAWSGNSGLINNSNFNKNSANFNGTDNDGDAGALSVLGCSIHVDNSYFAENNAYDKGGAIGVDSNSNFIVTNSIFKKNNVYKIGSVTVFGGAIFVYKTVSSASINNCTFDTNYAQNYAAAIYSASRLTVKSSLFINNTAGTSAPVLYAESGGISISDCVILNNVAVSSGYIISGPGSGYLVNANFNWWGNTINNQKTKPKVNTATVRLDHWYFLDIQTNDTYFFPDEVCNVTYRLDHYIYSSGTIMQRELNYTLPNLFNYTATIGDLAIYSSVLNGTRHTNNTFVSNVHGICTLTVTAMGITASTKVIYVPIDSFMALQMLINRNYGTTLNLTHDYQYYQEYDSPLLSTGIKITDSINITGNGYTLNAKSKLRIFYISGNDVNIDGLTYINGYSSGVGGAMYITGARINITNSNILSSSAYTYGGAIDIISYNVSIINTTFDKNKIRVGANKKNDYGGGAVIVHNSAYYCSIVGCVFKNSYSSESGGAIYWSGAYGLLQDTYFEANNAQKYDGGAVYIKSSAINLIINNITAYKNKDGGYGCAIASFATNTIINNSRFLNNDYNNARKYGATVYFAASGAKIYNSYFYQNRAYNGGAISTQSSNSVINNVTFVGNKAVYLGGAINVQGSPSNMVVSDCIFDNNYAGGAGGAIRVTSTKASNFKLLNSTFKNNHAYNYGGAVSVQSANVVINKCDFDNNYVSKVQGGALDLNGNYIIVDNSTFNNNRAISGGAIAWYRTGGKLLNSVFTNNVANKYDGGALYVSSGATNMYICNVTMNKNTAKYAGSAILSDTLGINIINSSFAENKNTAASYGGTICFYKNKANVIGCNFTSNNNYYGGAIYTRGKTYTVVVEKCIFVNNYARSSGGGIHVTKGGNANISDSIFIGNSAYTCGGDIDTYGVDTFVARCTFTNSVSPRGGSINVGARSIVIDSNFSGSKSDKGAAINIGTVSKILNCNFYNASATNYGGAIYAGGSGSLINNSNFTLCTSNLGGAVYIAIYNILTNNLFDNNTASTYGGAIYSVGKDALVNNSQFNNNRATKAGGAIYLSTVGVVSCSNFSENTAGDYGGAVYVVAANSKLNNDTFNFNNATVDGGAVFVVGQSVLINQSIFNQNNAVNGPGIYWQGASGVMQSCVVDNHTTTGLGAIYVKGNNFDISLTNMSFNTAKNGGALYIAGNNANMIDLNLINNTANYGGALYTYGRYPTVSSTNFTNNRAKFGAGMFVGNDITLNPSNFTNNVASKLGGAGYSFEFIDHVGTTLTYENWTTQTDNFYSAYVKLLNDTIFVGQTVILRMVNETYTGNVTLEIGNRSYNTTWINVTHRLADVSDLPWGVYSDIHAVYHATGSQHNEEFALVDLTVNRYPVNVTLINNVTIVKGKVNLTINETLASGNITICFENGLEYMAQLNNSVASIQLDNLIGGGEYNITIKYSGDDIYDEFTGPGYLRIDKLDAIPYLELNWAYVDGAFVVILPEDADGGEINITIGGQIYEANVNGNVTEILLEALLSNGTYNNVKLSYSGNDLYNSNHNITVFEVLNYPVDIVVGVNETDVNSTLVFFLYSDDPYDITGTVSFVINGVTYSANVVKEYDDEEDTSTDSSYSFIAYVDIEGLPGGIYQNVTVNYNSNTTYYKNNDIKANFTIYKWESFIWYAGPDILDTNKLLVFNVTELTTGNVSFWCNGQLYAADLHSVENASEAIIDVSNLPKGVYEVLVSYNGDDFFNPSNVTVRFVVKETPNIILNNIGDVYGNTILNVNITSNVTGIAYIYVDGLKHAIVNVTQYTGDCTVFNVSLNNVSAGMHNITVEYPGDELHFNNTVSMELFIKRANSNVVVIDYVNATYNTTSILVNFTVDNRTSVYINLTDGEGNTLYYNFTSDNHIIFSNLDVGKYLINITNEESLNYNASSTSIYVYVFKANSFINVTGIVNGTFNTTNATVDFTISNRTNVTVIVYQNGTGVVVYNNTNFTGTTFTIGNLTTGVYNITIKNNESGCYNEYVESVLFEVYKAQTEISITNIVNGTYNTTNATVDFTITNRTNVTVIVYQNGAGVVVYNNTNFTGTTFTIGNLSAGVYNITIFNAETDNFNAFNATALFEVYRAKSLVNITNVVNATYNTTNVTVNFDVVNKTNVTIIVYNANSSEVIKLTNYDALEFVIGNLTSGIYNITIINAENQNYTGFTDSALFVVDKANSLVNITETIDGVYNTTDVVVKFNITNRTDVKVVITRNGTIVYNNTNFTADEFVIDNLTAGIYNITITNLGDDNYYSSSDSALFTVFKVNSTVDILNVVNATYNTTNVEVQFSITNRTTVSIVIRNAAGEIVYSNDDFQGDLFTIGNLTSGNYNITITNNADENHNPSNDSALFTVFKANSSLIITGASNSTYKVNNTVISLDVVNMTSISYIIYDIGGQVVATGNVSSIPFVLDDLNVGVYNITVINVETNNFLSSNDTATFTVIKSYSTVNITDIVNGTLDISNATVKFDINIPTNVSVIVKDSNGKVVYSNPNFNGNVFSIGNLTTGVYNITVLNAETDNVYASNDSGLFKVVVPTTIPSTNISRGYNSPYDYVATFTDEFGNKLNNTNVSMIVNGEIYNITTDENGTAYLNATLPVGVYEIKLVNPVSGENVTHTTTIVERLQENRDIVMDFCDGTHYRVRAYGDDGKPIEGVYVEITINGVTYDVKTDKNGYALLKIRLNPNKFKITAEWKDYKINKIVVRQTLKAKSVKAKQSKNLKFSATLKWSSGKPIAGKKIVFKFRGKKYVAKTNKKGIATIKIKKSVLKKLKAGKKYHISITYNNIDNGYISVNNISKTIKIIK